MLRERVRRPAQRLNRSKSGAGFVELAAGIFVIALLLALGSDACLSIFAACVNDSACRDAVKSAASATNYAEARKLAQEAVANHKTRDLMVTPPIITKFDYESSSELPPLGDTAYVSVTTRSMVRLPAPLLFYGTSASSGTVSFTQSYSYPVLVCRQPLRGHSWGACHPRMAPLRMVK